MNWLHLERFRARFFWAPGWLGLRLAGMDRKSMARRRPFHAKGPQSASSTHSRRPRPGSSSGPRPPKAGPPRRDHAGSRHETASKSRKPTPPTDSEAGKPERLQKVLAHAGLGSRRGCEELILQGRVSINGEVIRAARHAGRSRQCSDRGRRRADQARVDGLLRRQQAQGLRLDQLRPLRPSARRRPASRDSRSGSTPSAGSTRTAPGC